MPELIDAHAVARLADVTVGPQDKALPASCWGLTPAEVVALGLRRSDLPTPLLTLSERALDANIDLLARWAAERGLALAPHGKTTMAPQLWARQVAAGAWGITVANLSQLAVARAFGVRRIMVANLLLAPPGLRWLAGELAADADLEVTVWADSVEAVAAMDAALGDAALGSDSPGAVAGRPVDVLVELGGPGGRTGARDAASAMEVARAITRSAHLRLVGVAGYEGALAHDSDAAGLAVVRDYLRDLGDLHRAVAREGLYAADVRPVVTAGGSAYFELVAEVLGPLAAADVQAESVDVVLRSGAYLVHDDGFYRHISPLGDQPRVDGGHLTSAMHGWVRVTSQPEPGTAIIDAGKRDLPFDEGLPTVQRLAGGDPLDGIEVTALNDQHGFLSFDTGRPAPVQVGDVLRLGLSHPCTAFDKWGLIPVLDDADADDPLVIDLIRTRF